MKTPIVTLTTDWGEWGIYTGMVKGALASLVEGVQVVDITHRLEAFNKVSASFVVRHACTGFPEGTVHIIDVGAREPYVALRSRGQYYLCSDNGLPSLALDGVDEAVQLPTRAGGVYNFAAYNLFCHAAATLLRGGRLADLGTPYPRLVPSTWLGYVRQVDDYRINVQYVDAYGNVYLGIGYDEFEALRQGRPFVIQVLDMEVCEFSTSYYRDGSSAGAMRLLLTVSATGQLELAFCERSLAQFTGLKPNSSVLLHFKS